MSDGPKPVHPDIKRLNDAWQDGYYGRHGDYYRLQDAASQQAYERGKRARDMGQTDPGDRPKQTLGEAIATAFGLAGAAAGLLFGLYRVGEGQGSWLGVLVLLLVGLVAGVLMWALVSGAARRGRKAILWRRGSEERDAATLERMWEARFGRAIPEALLAEIDDEGRGWTLDGKANFHLRMKTGKEFSVGVNTDSGALAVGTSGRGASPLEDAYHFVLIHDALGHDSIHVDEGSKKTRRALWAAASLVGLDVVDYTPDAKAVRMLADMKEQYSSRGAGGSGPGAPEG